VVGATKLTAELAATAAEGPDFIGAVLLIASVVALFLATFLIRNTYTIILAVRSRELALLRCVGASRAQLARSVLLEAAIVGALAAVAGLLLGIGIAKGLAVLLQIGGAITVDVIGSPSQIMPRTVLVALEVGIVVASVSAWRPVRRSTRVPPVAALRGDAFGLDRRSGRARATLGALAVAAGCVFILTGAVAEPVHGRHIQVGSALAAVGVVLLGPVLAPRLAIAIAAPIRRTVGVVGTLARNNAVRSPGRTAATALPIAIGLGLVGFLLTLANGTKTSIVDTVDRTLQADYQVRAFGQRTAMSTRVADRLAGLPEVAAVASVRSTSAYVGADRVSVAAADPARLAAALSLDVTEGALANVDTGGVAVTRQIAEAKGLRIGSPVTLRLANRDGTFTVRVIYDADPEALALNQLAVFHYLIGPANYQRLGGPPGLDTVYVSTRDGVAPEEARAAIAGAVAQYPNVEVLGRDDVQRRSAAPIDPALRVYYSLFALMILIALFGIANTLALSILERVREIGVLRAVGMHRGQVRAMIRWEAAIISGIGTVLGLGLGAFVGWAATRALAQTATGIPVFPLVACAATAVTAGVLVTILPARRAAGVNIIRALATE
jgi:putative ABC transport system permease protein